MTGLLLHAIDDVQLNFSPDGLLILNICLGFIMFGVALELKLSHFKVVFSRPRALATGVVSQFLLLPLITFLLTLVIAPFPSMALGMILVAACPGGNISNFISLLAKGNAALSVGLTAIATLSAILITPLNFSLYGYLNTATSPILREISLNPWRMIETVVLLLGLPMVLGLWVSHRFPAVTQRISKTIKVLSIVFFMSFVVVAFAQNWAYFLEYIDLVFVLVLLHNAIALLTGYFASKVARLDEGQTRSITIETGIQNSGLALILIFNFFDGLGGMAIIAAWWGLWHIIAGLTLAAVWSRIATFQNVPA